MIEPTTEAQLKSALMRATKLLPIRWEKFRHEDSLRAGIPDISITGNDRTVWWEVKHANPKIRDRGIQHYTCCRLAQAGRCFYVIYYETAKMENRKTYIVHPAELSVFKESTLWVPGFSHPWVVGYMQKAQQ